MKSIIYITLLAILIGLTTSCGTKQPNLPSSDYMAFEDVDYIDIEQFSEIVSLDSAIEVYTNAIGLLDFRIYDSLIIFSTKNRAAFWAFVSLQDYRFLGEFLSSGQGPGEVLDCPFVSSDAQFFRENGDLVATISPFEERKLYRINIDQSLKDNKLDFSVISDSCPRFLMNFIMQDTTTFFCKKFKDTYTQAERYLLKQGKKVIPQHFETLNSAKINPGEDFNMLSTLAAYNFENKRLIEVPLGLNYINLYTTDGTFGKTICIGNELDNLTHIQAKAELDRMYTFADVRSFSEFWGVLHINQDERTFRSDHNPEILWFDWDGKPLARLKLNRSITAFDIDFAKGELYTLDHRTEEFYKYDILDILQKLKRNE